MRQFVWYSPEFNFVILQTIVEGASIGFEWDWTDLTDIQTLFDDFDSPPSDMTTWIPLGEL